MARNPPDERPSVRSTLGRQLLEQVASHKSKRNPVFGALQETEGKSEGEKDGKIYMTAAGFRWNITEYQVLFDPQKNDWPVPISNNAPLLSPTNKFSSVGSRILDHLATQLNQCSSATGQLFEAIVRRGDSARDLVSGLDIARGAYAFIRQSEFQVYSGTNLVLERLSTQETIDLGPDESHSDWDLDNPQIQDLDFSSDKNRLTVDFLLTYGDSMVEGENERKWRFFLFNSSPHRCTINGINVPSGRLAGPLDGFAIVELGSYSLFWWSTRRDVNYVPPLEQSSTKRQHIDSPDIVDTTETLPKRRKLIHGSMPTINDVNRDLTSFARIPEPPDTVVNVSTSIAPSGSAAEVDISQVPITPITAPQTGSAIPPASHNGRIFHEKTYQEMGISAPPISERTAMGHPLIADINSMSLRSQLKTRLTNLEMRRKQKFMDEKTLREEVPFPKFGVLGRQRTPQRDELYEYCWEIEQTPLQDLDVFHAIGALAYGTYHNPATDTMESNYMMQTTDIMATWQATHAVDEIQQIIKPVSRYLTPKPAFIIPVIATGSNSFSVGHFVLVICYNAVVDYKNRRVLVNSKIMDSKTGHLTLEFIKSYVESVVKNSCWLWDDGNHGSIGVQFRFSWDEPNVLQQGLDSNCGYHVILNFYAFMIGYNVDLPEGQEDYRLDDAESREFARDAKQMINCALGGFIDKETILAFLNRWNMGGRGPQSGKDIFIESTPILRLKEPGRKKHSDKSYLNKGLNFVIDQAARELQTLKQEMMILTGKNTQEINDYVIPYWVAPLAGDEELARDPGDGSSDDNGDPARNESQQPPEQPAKRRRGRPSGKSGTKRSGRKGAKPNTKPPGLRTPPKGDLVLDVLSGVKEGRIEKTKLQTSKPPLVQPRPSRAPETGIDFSLPPTPVTAEDFARLPYWEQMEYNARLRMAQRLAARRAQEAAAAVQEHLAGSTADQISTVQVATAPSIEQPDNTEYEEGESDRIA